METERGPLNKQIPKPVTQKSVDGFITPRRPIQRRPIMATGRRIIDPDTVLKVTKPQVKLSVALKPASIKPEAAKPKPQPKPKAAVVAINMALPGSAEHGASRYALRQAKNLSLTKTRIVRRSITGAMALLLIIAGSIGLQAYLSLSQALHGGAETAAALNTSPESVDPNSLKGEGSGRVNILLLGKGGAGHPGGDLTDTMMIASVDPVNSKLALLSIPRDLWVDSPAGGTSKINAVYYNARAKHLAINSNDQKAAEAAGISAVEGVVSDVTGLPINYYAMFDFTAFKDAVDVVGGITINVPADLYDPSIAWENGNNPLIAKQGVQQMTGDKALLYVRSRKTSSDFARSERQRAVIEAIESSASRAGFLANPLKMNDLLKVLGNHLSSDLSISSAQKLAVILKKIDMRQAKSIGLTDDQSKFLQTDRVGDQSVVRPIAGYNNYDAIRSYVRNQIRDGYLAKEDAPILIINASSKDYRAGDTMSDLLKSYGYNIVGVKQSAKSYDKTQLVDSTSNQSVYTKHYLEDRLGVRAQSQSGLNDAIDTSGAQFVIIVGND